MLYFERIAQRWICFSKLTVAWGFCPENIAFALFYISFIWLLLRLFVIKPIPKPDKQSLEFYIDLLHEKSFEEFFKFLTKYTSAKNISANWQEYKELLFQPKFLKNILENKPSFLLQFWKKFNTENDFQSIFRLFLENPNSAYYSEIRGHWNSYGLLDDKPFLTTVIKDNLKQSIHNGILMVFTDHVSKYLQAENGKVSIYNQEHYYPKIREDEGFELPIYYHIRFIGLMYSSAIENKTDISAISQRYTNMQTIYSNMVEQMVANIVVTEQNVNKENPTNYHWLIGEIFDLQSHWLTSFGDEWHEQEIYFDKDSSYISFIPFSMSLCLSELYKALGKEKITIAFLNRKIYYSILSHYFNSGLNDTMKASIEDEVIKRIPTDLLELIFDFALDEKFAIDFENLINEDFRLTNQSEKQILLRLLNFLRDNNMI